MNKNNYFTFSSKNFMIRYGIIFGIIEIILIYIAMYIFPLIILLSVLLFFIFIVHLEKCKEQNVTLNPFQIIKIRIIDDRTPGNSLYEKKKNVFTLTNLQIIKLIIFIL